MDMKVFSERMFTTLRLLLLALVNLIPKFPINYVDINNPGHLGLHFLKSHFKHFKTDIRGLTSGVKMRL